MVLERAGYVKIHGDVGERRLEAYPGRDVDVENEFLDRLFDFAVAEFVIADEGCQQRVEIGQRLGAGRFPLEGVEKIDDLTQRRTQVIGRGAFHLALDPLEPVAQQIGKVPANAVDRQQTEVVNVDVALGMGPPDFRWIDFVEPVFCGDV